MRPFLALLPAVLALGCFLPRFDGRAMEIPVAPYQGEQLSTEELQGLARLMQEGPMAEAVVTAAMLTGIRDTILRSELARLALPRFWDPAIRMEHEKAIAYEVATQAMFLWQSRDDDGLDAIGTALTDEDIDLIEAATGLSSLMDDLRDSPEDEPPAGPRQGGRTVETVFVTPRTVRKAATPKNPCPSRIVVPPAATKGTLSLAGMIQYYSSHAQLKQYTQVARNYVETPNFAIFFDPGALGGVPGVEPEYVTRLRGHLEFAFQRAQELGMVLPEPHWDTRITVTLVPRAALQGAGSGGYVGNHAWDTARDHFHIVLPMGLDEQEMRETTAHEVFHVFQLGFRLEPSRRGEIRWLMDGTATAVEDIVNGVLPGSEIGFPPHRHGFLETWIDKGAAFSGSASDFRYGPGNNELWYGNSILFKWWTENLKDGDCLIPALFQGGTTSHARSRNSLLQEIEKRGPGDFADNLLKAGIAAYLLDGPPPFGVKRGAAIKALLEETGTALAGRWLPLPDGATVSGGYDPASGRIARHEASIDDWAAYRRGLRPAANGAVPMFVAADTGAARKLRVGVIETSDWFQHRSGKRVTLLDLGIDGQESFVIPRVADGGDGPDTTEVEIFAVNGSMDGHEVLKWSAGIGGPPYLKKVEVRNNRNDLIYEAEWREADLPDKVMTRDAYRNAAKRTLYKSGKAVETAGGNDRLKDVRVRLTFSKPVALQTAFLGKTRLDPSPETDRFRTQWRLEAPTVEPKTGQGGVDEVRLEVEAMDRDRAQLDGDPSTPSILRRDGTGWTSFEDETGVDTGLGGFDDRHDLGPFGCRDYKPDYPQPRPAIAAPADPSGPVEMEAFAEELLQWEADRYAGMIGVETSIVTAWLDRFRDEPAWDRLGAIRILVLASCTPADRRVPARDAFTARISGKDKARLADFLDDLPHEMGSRVQSWFLDIAFK